MISIGQINKLIVTAETASGYYLLDTETEEEVFLPPALASSKLTIDQEVEVFVYLDARDTIIATTELPNAVVGEYAFMSVKDTTDFGAFMDWGIGKDLLIPGNQQKLKIRKFDEYIVRVCLENETNRIYGTTKLGKYIETSNFEIIRGDKVKMTICQETPLGFKVIIDKSYIGLIYHNEIYSNVVIGQTYDGYVKKLRDDGFVDVTLQPLGVEQLLNSKDKILDFLSKNDGKSNLHDKSSPEDIKDSLGMSKQAFKRTIGMLYKDRKITINNDGIQLT
jgi:predicted RNA-binding protein (virulence factor B family)